MKVTLWGFDAGVWRQADDEAEMELLAKLFNRLTIDLQRVPCVGEGISLARDGYSVTATVKKVWTEWVEPGDPYIKEEYFGDVYGVSVDDVEIIECYGKRG